MKQLTNIRLVNWHLFENTTIPCHGTTYFIGTNGVGKSTILDAIQFALVGGQRDVKFNQAAAIAIPNCHFVIISKPIFIQIATTMPAEHR